jgi:hypothetical protein
MVMAEKKQREVRVVGVPAGTPAWVSADLIDHTIRVWEPYYGRRLTREDAVEILIAVGNLADALGR